VRHADQPAALVAVVVCAVAALAAVPVLRELCDHRPHGPHALPRLGWRAIVAVLRCWLCTGLARITGVTPENAFCQRAEPAGLHTRAKRPHHARCRCMATRYLAATAPPDRT
jgi:hypothetical protein